MNPNTARQVLRIFPDAPLTVELVERAYSEESWARHPSRYADPSQRPQAEAWARSLAEARAVLLTEVEAGNPAFGGAVVPRARRRLGALAISGIAVGALALVAFITFASIGAVRVVSTTVDGIAQQGEGASVERYQSGETLFEFPASLEIYADGRYDDLCDAEYTTGCWQDALFPEAACSTLNVVVGFSNDADAWEGDVEDILEFEDVAAGDALPVVFGNDDYEYGWVHEVRCLETPS